MSKARRKNLFIIGVTWGILFLLLCSSSLFAQPKTSYSLYKGLNIKARILKTDKLSQFYLVNEKNDVIKYNPAGTEVFRYTNNKLGDLEILDVSNPFHILLYYPDYGSLLILDRTLNEINRFNLLDLGIPQTQAVGISFDNNIWVYDEMDLRLRKYNKQGKVVVESVDLGSIFSDKIYPTAVFENNNQVYLHDPETGLLIFDLFGQYIKTFPIQGLSSFQVRDQHLFGIQGGQYFVWQINSNIKYPIPLPMKWEAGMQMRLEQNSFFVLQQDSVKVFRRQEKSEGE